MALSACILPSCLTKLTAKQRGSKQCQRDLDWQHPQRYQREQPAIGHHHHDVHDRQRRIQHSAQRLTRQKATDFLQFAYPGPQFAHRPSIEIPQGQPQQMINHLRTKPQINPIGGFRKQKGAQSTKHSLQKRHHHQRQAQHL